MIKKIWFSLLFLFGILFVWVSFANPIAPTLYCDVIKNVEIDDYKVIIEQGKKNTNLEESNLDNSWRSSPSFNWKREVYEPKTKECIKCSRHFWLTNISKVYLLNKSIDISDITQENIDDKAIFVWEINSFDCSDSYYDRVNTYEITKNWNSYNLELRKTTSEKIKRRIKNNLEEFPYAWFVTVIIETLLLFVISKYNWKEEKISNKKIILFWIIPTTITLPLFWFALPLLMWIWIRYNIIWEILVISLEAIIIKYWLDISRGKAIKASIFCNIISLMLWSVILKLLDWLLY